MMRIIINADDFGVNDIVTDEIVKLIEKKAISSATIMANGKSLERVKNIVNEHQEISYGVHLCLDEFDSLTKSEILYKYGLVDKDNAFVRGAVFQIKKFPDELKNAIFEELSAQIKKLLEMGIPVSHIDSHHHFHTIYNLKDVISALMLKYKINRVRLSTTISLFQIIKNRTSNHSVASSDIVRGPAKNNKKKKLLFRILHLITTNYRILKINKYFSRAFKVTNGFESYTTFLNSNHIKKKYNQYHIVELMCHPGHPDNKYKVEADEVNEMLLVKNPNYKLISYNEL